MIDNKTIIDRVAKELNISKLKASKVISKTFREIENALLEDNSFGCAYTGCSKKLDSLNLDLQGMKTGLENLTERLSE